MNAPDFALHATRAAVCALLLACLPGCSARPGLAAPDRAVAGGPDGLPTISEYTAALDARPGYFPLYWDEAGARLLLEVPRFDEPFLYLTSLVTGLGSDDLLADRGTVWDERIARFRRVGGKVLLELENPRFRGVTDSTDALARSVEESFPTSVVGAFEPLAEEGDRVLIDASLFFLRDAIDLVSYLRRNDQGSFRLDRDRSAIHLPRTKSFPENTEVEAVLTFESDAPGTEIRRHTPEPGALTSRQHHSLVELPGPGYDPRPFDPRVGVFPIAFYDFGKPFDEDYVTRYAARHRLIKKDPDAALSEPIEPIVYYMDPAIPEPYRSAFKVGGEWWNQTLRAAGFIDAFRIEDMPPDMDPMDARYHVIQWVHRTEAGSSVGPSFRDPRTGEIIKAAVRMDSYRSLANYNTYAGIAGVDGEWFAGTPPGVTGEEFVMMRRRQHSAHEIGHTLGLAHNFIAISYGHASVMDYPAPVVRLVDGRLDLSQAYAPGPGPYDTLAIRYAYQPAPAGMTEEAFLNGLLAEAQERGWHFITNPDAGAGNSYPAASWWVNGSDMVDELERVIGVRAFLLDQFGEPAIRIGEPMHKLWQRFAPVYFHHRATYEAAIKTIGGMEYRYGLRGDPAPVTRLIGPEQVGEAMDVLMRVLEPEALAIPESVLRILAPESFAWIDGRTEWETAADPAFDQVSAARTVASEVVGGILERSRAARVVAFHARDPELPSLERVVARLVDEAWGRPDTGGHAALVRVVQRVIVDELLDLATNERATVEARAAAEWGLRRALDAAQVRPRAQSPSTVAHRQHVAADIERFLDRDWAATERSEPLEGPGWARDGGGERLPPKP